MKNIVAVTVRISLEDWEKVLEWEEETGHKTSAITRAALRAGLNTQNELYEQLKKEKNQWQ